MNLVRLTEPAVQDLEQIYYYIVLDNLAAADRLKARLQERWRDAAEHPGVGRKRDDLQLNLRSVSEGNYLIFYRVLDSPGIEIIRILHGSRDFDKLFEV